MRSTTIFAIIGLVSTLSLIASKEQAMPFAFHSKNNALNFSDDLFSTKDQLLDKFAASISTKDLQNGVKAIVINIRTPSSMVGTINYIKKYATYLPQLNNLTKSYFRQQIVYDAINFIQELQNTLKKNNIQVEVNSSETKTNSVNIEEIEVQLSDITQLEQTVKKALDKSDDENAAVFVLFTEDAHLVQQPRILQEVPVTNSPSMVQIPSQTLFALILLFTLFLPVLYIAISCLYGIESPEKFASQNLVIGREY